MSEVFSFSKELSVETEAHEGALHQAARFKKYFSNEKFEETRSTFLEKLFNER